MAAATHTDLSTDLKDAQLHLLLTAERLFAQQGVDAVSTREIARAAGQRNHSAVAYHFGSREQLVQTLLDYRMLPANSRRQALLDDVEAQGQTDNARALVHVMIAPFVELLAQDPSASYYPEFTARLYSSKDGLAVLQQNPRRSAATLKAGAYLADVLRDLPEALRRERLQALGAQISHTVAEWAQQSRERSDFDVRELPLRMHNLVDVLTAGLLAPMSDETRALLNQKQAQEQTQ